MKKSDIATLYDIALRSFQPDYEKYGVFPPLLKEKTKTFLPPRMFSKTILFSETIIGGAFVVGFFSKGEIGAIFLEPSQQHNGYGKQIMLMIEKLYPKVTRWKLDTPSESYGLHQFYESLGYIKTGEMEDRGMKGFIYEKSIS